MENDYIKREDALEIVADWNEYDEDYQNENCMAERLRRLPAADVEPVRHGKWIGDTCSECGNERAWYGNNPDYCPDCGAKMDVKELKNGK